MSKKLLGGAAVAVSLAGEAVRHVAWYVIYKVDGRARERPG